MTHIGLLMIVVADPAISPMIIDSEVLKALLPARDLRITSLERS